MLNQLDSGQVPTTTQPSSSYTVALTSVVLPSAILAHPEFQQGLLEAYEQFEGDYEPAPLTQDEMVDEVESNLSRRVTERCKKLAKRLGWDTPPSYFYNLGFVIGTIDKGLSYAR